MVSRDTVIRFLNNLHQIKYKHKNELQKHEIHNLLNYLIRKNPIKPFFFDEVVGFGSALSQNAKEDIEEVYRNNFIL